MATRLVRGRATKAQYARASKATKSTYAMLTKAAGVSGGRSSGLNPHNMIIPGYICRVLFYLLQYQIMMLHYAPWIE